jgi:hypothetical protein
MTIKRVTEMAEVLKLVPIEIKLREKEKSEVPTKDILAFVQGQLQTNPYFGMWIVEDEDIVLGYVGLFLNVVGGIRDLHIWRVWHDPHHPEVMDVLYKTVTDCAKNARARTMKIDITRGAKAYEKKWGFKPVSTIMERRL